MNTSIISSRLAAREFHQFLGNEVCASQQDSLLVAETVEGDRGLLVTHAALGLLRRAVLEFARYHKNVHRLSFLLPTVSAEDRRACEPYPPALGVRPAWARCKLSESLL